jgi:hypothetical protein
MGFREDKKAITVSEGHEPTVNEQCKGKNLLHTNTLASRPGSCTNLFAGLTLLAARRTLCFVVDDVFKFLASRNTKCLLLTGIHMKRPTTH